MSDEDLLIPKPPPPEPTQLPPHPAEMRRANLAIAISLAAMALSGWQYWDIHRGRVMQQRPWLFAGTPRQAQHLLWVRFMSRGKTPAYGLRTACKVSWGGGLAKSFTLGPIPAPDIPPNGDWELPIGLPPPEKDDFVTVVDCETQYRDTFGNTYPLHFCYDVVQLDSSIPIGDCSVK